MMSPDELTRMSEMDEAVLVAHIVNIGCAKWLVDEALGCTELKCELYCQEQDCKGLLFQARQRAGDAEADVQTLREALVEARHWMRICWEPTESDHVRYSAALDKVGLALSATAPKEKS